MKTKIGSILVMLGCCVALNAAAGDEGNGDSGKENDRFAARLKPTEEVPALSSAASGWFKLTIDEANQMLSYELRYDNLEGTPAQAHIHIGQRHVNGGITVFLCGTAPAGFPAVPECPATPASVTGVITPANIIGPAPQGIEAASTANEFDELVRMIRRGLTYANVHSSRFPGGEIRGQILSTKHK
jgi:hypothetical protein